MEVIQERVSERLQTEGANVNGLGSKDRGSRAAGVFAYEELIDSKDMRDAFPNSLTFATPSLLNL